MAQLSDQGNNAIIYCTFAFLLVTALLMSWKYGRADSFLSHNGTQRGPALAVNFIAASVRPGMLMTYPKIANRVGLHGLLVYSLAGGSAILAFAIVGPLLRKKCPEGFVLTAWVGQRFGVVTQLYLSFFSLLTMFLFMIGDLSSLRQAIETLTGLNAVPVIIVLCAVTTIYTTFGGFRISFITDNLQGGVLMLVVIIACASVGAGTKIDRSLIGESKLLEANTNGWQLLYILPVAIWTNNFFISGYWLRTFASKSTKDLWIGCGLAGFFVCAIHVVVGMAGMLVVWAGYMTPSDKRGGIAFYFMLAQRPKWIVAFVIIFIITGATCVFDAYQSGMVSSISNDLFKNKLKMIYVRALVVVVMIPTAVLAIKVADDVLQIYLIADLVSASVVPAVLLGLSDKYFWYLTGFDTMFGGLSGLLGVFIFGCIYYGTALEGGRLLLVWNGIYNAKDWGAFGAFVVTPVCGVGFTILSAWTRIGVLKLYSMKTGAPFTALDKPERMLNPTDNEVEIVRSDSTTEKSSADKV